MPITRSRTLFTSPVDDCHAALLAAAGSATKSLHVLIYGFTLLDLGQLLIAKKSAGVIVGVVADRSQSAGPAEHALLQTLVNAGVDVVITTSTVGGQILHQKCILLDIELGPTANESYACYGSFNFSASAQKQANHLQLDNDPSVCEYFMQQYNLMRAFGMGHPDWQILPTTPAPR